MKRDILLSLAIMAALGASAEVLTPAQALARVGQTDSPVRRAASAISAIPSLTVNADGQPAVYIIGSMVVSAESETTPLLGYSDEPIDPDNLPDGLQWLIENYRAEIEGLRRNSANASPYKLRYASAKRATVSPLCTTLWNQSTPYNNLCPQLNGTRTVAGCVATAVAQVMRALPRHPDGGTGSISYTWSTGNKNLSLDFSSVTFDWDNMLDSYTGSYTTKQANAVATLHKAVGYAAKMEYNLDANGGSGSQSSDIACGLVKYLGYDASTARYLMREWFTAAEWQQLVYDEIAAGRPVYYSGVNADYTAGHAFVVDGYSSDNFFHLNWGWGGLSNGYYLLSALDPAAQGIGGSDSGYNYASDVIVGLQVADTDNDSAPCMVIYTDGALSPQSETAKTGSTVTFNTGLWCGSIADLPYVKVMMHFTNTATGAQAYTSTSFAYTNMTYNTGLNSFTAQMPTSLANGTYLVDLVARNASSGGTETAVFAPAGSGKLYATVSNGTVTFRQSTASITYRDITVSSPLYAGHRFTVNATQVNESEEYFSGEMGWAIGSVDSSNTFSILSYGVFYADAEPNSETTFTATGSLDSSLAAGTYYILFYDSDGNIYSNAVPVTVEADPGTATLSAISLSVTNAHRNNLEFTAKVKCTGGYYDNRLAIGLFDSSGNYIDIFYGSYVNFYSGKSYQSKITGTYADGTVGNRFIAALYRVDSGSPSQLSGTSYTYFNLEDDELDPTSAITEVDDQTDTHASPVYDLQGRRLKAAPSCGLYIQDGKLNLMK